jgi:hypothetical protein
MRHKLSQGTKSGAQLDVARAQRLTDLLGLKLDFAPGLVRAGRREADWHEPDHHEELAAMCAARPGLVHMPESGSSHDPTCPGETGLEQRVRALADGAEDRSTARPA